MAKSRESENSSTIAHLVETSLKLFAGLLVVFSQTFPALSYFRDYAPPFFPPLLDFVIVVAFGFFLHGFISPLEQERLPWRGLKAILAGITLIAVYGVLFEYLTVAPQEPGFKRKQIGFHMWSASLTDHAKQLIRELPTQETPSEMNTPNDLMDSIGVWGGEGRTDEIWHLWSILLAGVILYGFYLVGYSLWSYGVGLYAKYLIGESPRKLDKKFHKHRKRSGE